MCMSASSFAQFDPGVPDTFSWDDHDDSYKKFDLGNSAYQQLITANYNAVNQTQTGLRVNSSVTIGSLNGYNLYGIYGSAQSRRDNNALRQDITGILGAAFKTSGKVDAAGLECDVFDSSAGGTSACLKVRFSQSLPGTATVGIDISPPDNARNLVGIQLLHAPAYKYGIDMGGSKLAMGSKAGSTYCIQFNDATANLDYIKNCGTSSEQVVGAITITSVVLMKGKK